MKVNQRLTGRAARQSWVASWVNRQQAIDIAQVVAVAFPATMVGSSYYP
jgi:hypothetical protein